MKLLGLGTNPTCTDSEPGTGSIFIRRPKKNRNFFFRNNWCDQLGGIDRRNANQWD